MKNDASATHVASLHISKGRKPVRRKFLKRHILPSDNHAFVGRVCDLGIVQYHFDSYEALSRHKDCKYSHDINESLSILTRRVESLNLVGNMLWPETVPSNFSDFPVSRYAWLNVIADVFLMRYISVVDCTLLLINQIYQTNLKDRDCSIKNLEKKGVPEKVLSLLRKMIESQGELRNERNARFHHGRERAFTQDDLTFRAAAQIETWGNGVTGNDQFGRPIDLDNFLKEGLVELQREFNQSTRLLIRYLDQVYDELGNEFEARFVPLLRSAKHSFGVHRKLK